MATATKKKAKSKKEPVIVPAHQKATCTGCVAEDKDIRNHQKTNPAEGVICRGVGVSAGRLSERKKPSNAQPPCLAEGDHTKTVLVNFRFRDVIYGQLVDLGHKVTVEGSDTLFIYDLTDEGRSILAGYPNVSVETTRIAADTPALQPEVLWNHNGKDYVVPPKEDARACMKCMKSAVIALPNKVRKDLNNGNTHICLGLLGGCGAFSQQRSSFERVKTINLNPNQKKKEKRVENIEMDGDGEADEGSGSSEESGDEGEGSSEESSEEKKPSKSKKLPKHDRHDRKLKAEGKKQEVVIHAKSKKSKGEKPAKEPKAKKEKKPKKEKGERKESNINMMGRLLLEGKSKKELQKAFAERYAPQGGDKLDPVWVAGRVEIYAKIASRADEKTKAAFRKAFKKDGK